MYFQTWKRPTKQFQGRRRKDYDASFRETSRECPTVCEAATASLGHEQILPRAVCGVIRCQKSVFYILEVLNDLLKAGLMHHPSLLGDLFKFHSC